MKPLGRNSVKRVEVGVEYGTQLPSITWERSNTTNGTYLKSDSCGNAYLNTAGNRKKSKESNHLLMKLLMQEKKDERKRKFVKMSSLVEGLEAENKNKPYFNQDKREMVNNKDNKNIKPRPQSKYKYTSKPVLKPLELESLVCSNTDSVVATCKKCEMVLFKVDTENLPFNSLNNSLLKASKNKGKTFDRIRFIKEYKSNKIEGNKKTAAAIKSLKLGGKKLIF